MRKRIVRDTVLFILTAAVGAGAVCVMESCGMVAGFGRDLTSLSEGISGTQADQMKAMSEHRPERQP